MKTKSKSKKEQINNFWYYGNIKLDDDFVFAPEVIGFVYKIYNENTKKSYIGKKNLTKAGYRQVKGKKKKIRKESNWKEYFGSNEELLNDIKQFGHDKITRTVLTFCRSKGEMSYYETKFQFEEDVLLNPDKYYNTWIQCKIHRKHLKNAK